MDRNGLRIVFLGTPGFAVASLKALTEQGFNVVAVVTAPDRPAGRGMQLRSSEVKQYALSRSIPVLQPEKLKDPHFLERLRSFHADIQVVVAFRMLPELVWNMPRLGTINVHASLLPRYRGAAPINRALMNGEKETGVTTFRLRHEIDTGNILLQEALPIEDNETAGELHNRLMDAGARLLVRTMDGIGAGTLAEQPQPEAGTDLPVAPKLFTEDCRIDWSKGVDRVYNIVRGLSPFPGAFTSFYDKQLKIFRCRKEHTSHREPVGSFETDGKDSFRFACPDGFIYLEEVQLEGRKRMAASEFIRGFRMY